MKSVPRLTGRAIFGLAIALGALAAHAAGIDLQVFAANHADLVAGLSLMCIGDTELLMKAMDKLEKNIETMSAKADAERKANGEISTDTKTALDNLGKDQRAFADRLLQLEQKGDLPNDQKPADESAGALVIKSADYEGFVKAGAKGRMSVEVKNTVTNAIGNTFSERRPGIVEGPFRVFTIEDLLTAIPTTANAIDWIRENVFTNAAAETAEGVQKPQSSITFAPGTMPVSTVAHWIKITRQLAMDNAALAAYINRRMIYGVNLRVENQLVSGSGVSPNLSGLTNPGNFTAHGYTAASLAALNLANNGFDLVGKMMGDAALSDYPADVVILNTGDWWTLRLSKDAQGRYLLGDPASNVIPTLWGRPVVASNAMTVGKVWVGSLSQAATLHNREGVRVDMSESDENNFQLNLITIRAERRLALTVEKPAAARYGDLKPA